MTIEKMKEKLKSKIVESKTCQECAYYNYYDEFCELLVDHKLPDENVCEDFEQ